MFRNMTSRSKVLSDWDTRLPDPWLTTIFLFPHLDGNVTCSARKIKTTQRAENLLYPLFTSLFEPSWVLAFVMHGGKRFHLSPPSPLGLLSLTFFKCCMKKKKCSPNRPHADKLLVLSYGAGALCFNISWMRTLPLTMVLSVWALNVLWRRRSGSRRKHWPDGINQQSRASLLGNDAFANLDP